MAGPEQQCQSFTWLRLSLTQLAQRQRCTCASSSASARFSSPFHENFVVTQQLDSWALPPKKKQLGRRPQKRANCRVLKSAGLCCLLAGPGVPGFRSGFFRSLRTCRAPTWSPRGDQLKTLPERLHMESLLTRLLWGSLLHAPAVPFGDRGDLLRWRPMAGSAACCTPYIRYCPFFPVQSQPTELLATTEERRRRRRHSPGHKAGPLTDYFCLLFFKRVQGVCLKPRALLAPPTGRPAQRLAGTPPHWFSVSLSFVSPADSFCKDNTSKDPFSRCATCKNYGYSLS